MPSNTLFLSENAQILTKDCSGKYSLAGNAFTEETRKMQLHARIFTNIVRRFSQILLQMNFIVTTNRQVHFIIHSYYVFSNQQELLPLFFIRNLFSYPC